jgi:chemotaxis protein histidine kinase CheA
VHKLFRPLGEADGGDESWFRSEHATELEGLREHVEAVLELVSQAAGKVKAEAQAEAEAILEAKTREAAEKVEEAERDAEELRARAKGELEEAETESGKIRRRAEAAYANRMQEVEEKAEQKERALNERLDLIQGRLLELVDGVREMGSHPENLRSSSAEMERDEERDLEESLREVAHSSHDMGPHGGGD